jgi:hypothetical protein
VQAVPVPRTLALLRQHSGGIYALVRAADQVINAPERSAGVAALFAGRVLLAEGRLRVPTPFGFDRC